MANSNPSDLLCKRLAMAFCHDGGIDYLNVWSLLSSAFSSDRLNEVVEGASQLIETRQKDFFFEVVHCFCQQVQHTSSISKKDVAIGWIPFSGDASAFQDFVFEREHLAPRFESVISGAGLIANCEMFNFCTGLILPSSSSLPRDVQALKMVTLQAAAMLQGGSINRLQAGMSSLLRGAGCQLSFDMDSKLLSGCVAFYRIKSTPCEQMDFFTHPLIQMADYAGAIQKVRADLATLVPGVRFGAPGLLPHALDESRRMLSGPSRLSLVR